MNDQGLVMNRWRRYGKDRLYVETSDGAKVGFWDLVTDTGHPESPDHEPALLSAVTDWKARTQTGGDAAAPTIPVPEPDPATLAVRPASDGGGGADAGLTTLLAGTPVGPHHTPLPAAPVRLVESATRDITPTEPARPWIDLATNSAGAEAREQAQAARDAAPVKTVLARFLGVHTEERAWRIGADGEEKVAAQLAKVAKKDPRWRFLHAIPVGERGSDIDHLVIGPGGVFTVNAKHHPGAKIWVGGNTLMVNGHRQPYVRNSRHEAARAAKLLTAACGFPVHVEGLIVTVNADDIVVKQQPEGVSVVPRMQVAKWLRRHGDVHMPEAVGAIYEAARRSTTWQH